MSTSGLCECGCGEKARISPKTDRARGYVAGEPRRFLRGHDTRLPHRRAIAAELCRKLSITQVGEKNPLWRGDSASYSSIHKWVARNFTKTGCCEECGSHEKTEWSSTEHTYTRVRGDWRELCVPCHREIDEWVEQVREARIRKAAA